MNASLHISKLQTKLREKDPRIGYAHCIDPSRFATKSTKWGEFVIGSPLSFQLAPVEFNIKFVTNIKSIPYASHTTHEFSYLPLQFVLEEHEAYPRDWILNEEELNFLRTLLVNCDQSFSIEQETVLQSKIETWFELRKNRITSSVRQTKEF